MNQPGQMGAMGGVGVGVQGGNAGGHLPGCVLIISNLPMTTTVEQLFTLVRQVFFFLVPFFCFVVIDSLPESLFGVIPRGKMTSV